MFQDNVAEDVLIDVAKRWQQWVLGVGKAFGLFNNALGQLQKPIGFVRGQFPVEIVQLIIALMLISRG